MIRQATLRMKKGEPCTALDIAMFLGHVPSQARIRVLNYMNGEVREIRAEWEEVDTGTGDDKVSSA